MPHEIETPLSVPEITLAWWRTSHALHGSYYREPTMSETVIYTSPDQRYTLIVLDGRALPPDGRAMLVGVPAATNSPLGTVTATAADVGKYLDGATGQFVEKSVVDATVAAWQTYAAAHPKATPKEIWDAIEAPAASIAPTAPASDAGTPSIPSQPPVAAAPAPAPTGPGSDVGTPSDPTTKPVATASSSTAAVKPALALTPAEHAATKTWAEVVENEIHKLSADAAAAFRKLRTLLGHHDAPTATKAS
jgi:hypothetical protein